MSIEACVYMLVREFLFVKVCKCQEGVRCCRIRRAAALGRLEENTGHVLLSNGKWDGDVSWESGDDL